MTLSRFMDRSTFIFVIITAFSCLTRLISTVVVTHLATRLTAERNFPLAVTASVFEIFALFTLIAAIGLFLRRISPRRMMTAWIPGATFCSLGTLLTMVNLGLTVHYTDGNAVGASGHTNRRDLAVAALIIAVLGLIPQTAFWVLVLPRAEHSDASTFEAQASPTHSEKRRSIAVHLAALSPSRAGFFKSATEPTVDAHPDCKFIAAKSTKLLARKGLQPMSSKTRLLLGASFASRDSRSIHSRADSAEPARNNSDFENWDTSAVESFDSTFAQKTFLEPIPGSRPASPANPLDGPFGSEAMEPEAMPLPESPLRSPASECGASLRNFRRPSEHEETYYHPLFRQRPESPAPPLASPGTVITASPFAGQIVSPELVAPRILHSAASSRPASPGIMSPVRSQAGSIRSFRTVPTSPVDRTGAFSPYEFENRGLSTHAQP